VGSSTLRISYLSASRGATIDATLTPIESEKAYEALFEIGTQIQAQEADPGGVLELIVEKAAELVGTDVAWLGLVEDGSRLLEIVATIGASHEAFKRMRVEVGHGIGGVALERQETIVVADYDRYPQDTPDSVRSAVTEEGLVSMICAPMLREGRMVGALYVGNRDYTEFGGRGASLVSALAAQASIAIENSRLLRQLEGKNRTLEVSEAIHRRLTDASLELGGLDGIAATLAELLGRGIVVEQEVVPPFRRSYGAGEETDREAIGASARIAAGEDELGRILVPGPAALDELGRRALEHGATVLAVELLKERTAQEVEWRLGGELLAELLERTEPIDRRLAARAHRFGIDTEGVHRIAVLEASAGDLDERAVRLAAAPAIVPGTRAVLLTSLGPGRLVLALPEALEDRLDSVLQPILAAAGDSALGLSRPTANLRRGLREALACARFAALSGRTDAVILADDVGAMRFLFALDDPLPIQDYVDEQLGTLLSHARTHDTGLVETLRAFLESDGRHAAIAERCHIHPSTVKYRLRRIGEVLGRPLQDPEVRFELRLAVALGDVLSALSFAPALEDRASEPARSSDAG
jgi:DNA-binding PucR family transcriptional regulator/putative methionine-R-sulfoxide reductase with GAF domain